LNVSLLYSKYWRGYAITCNACNYTFQAMVSEWSRIGGSLTSLRCMRALARGWSSKSDRSLGLWRLASNLIIIRVDWSPSRLEVQITYTPTTSNCNKLIQPCRTSSAQPHLQALTQHIRQDVQKQLRQRLRHIVSRPPFHIHPKTLG
jgi:hypothetical protein